MHVARPTFNHTNETLKLLAACAFGLEAVVKRELIDLGYEPRVEQPGRIAFEGDWQAVCESNLWLRTADRVLIEVLQFDADNFDALFDTVKQYDWGQWLGNDAKFPVVAKTRHSQLTSVPAIQRSVKKAIVESLQRCHGTTALPESGANYKIEAALLNDRATITLDTTGPSLHKRGYRKLIGPAPLKETLAAALVQLSVWHPDRPLVDPFCGSGTILLEAGMLGRNIAPGLQRDFAFQAWHQLDQALFQQVRQAALQRVDHDRELTLIGTDRDPEVLSLARYHARQAGLENAVHFQQKSFSELRSKRDYGCIVTNPPYGERLEEQKRLTGLYESIPEIMQRLPTWSLFLLTSFPRLEKTIQRRATRKRKLYNGRIECTYFQFLGPKPPRLQKSSPETADHHSATTPEKPQSTDSISSKPSAESQPTAPLFGELTEQDQHQAELFASRLAKRARHFRRWPKRGITCFRIYERDIPEIPLVVDRYEDLLHLTEYERPHDRDLGRHAAWLELMKKTAAKTLDVPIQRTFLKQRRKDEQSGQYSKLDDQRRRVVVQEAGLKFLVNLQDYVDTGLFLDHRLTRQMVRQRSADKDVLNLFAYTGSFSVYAAAGKAASTTTVDLSRNYLDWAEENFRLNNLSGPQHSFVASDSMAFLESASRQGPQWDLAVVDPPTYSNSKRVEDDWDVQAQYAELLNRLHAVLRNNGLVYFSTNFRRFKFDEQQLPGYEAHEISQQTVPEDFRNKRIHRCWVLKKI